MNQLHWRIRNLTGQRFGRLVALEWKGSAKSREALWLCQCDCGNTTTVKSKNLVDEYTRHCGCLPIKGTLNYDKDYILTHIQVDPQTGCWNWTMAKSRYGYGKMNRRTGFHSAHRLAYHLWHGDAGTLCVCHKCDNRACVNPDHFFLGTRAENTMDAVRKGRHGGEASRNGKLKVADVHAIRASTKGQRALGLEFGVSFQAIGAIRRRENWKHVPERKDS